MLYHQPLNEAVNFDSQPPLGYQWIIESSSNRNARSCELQIANSSTVSLSFASIVDLGFAETVCLHHLLMGKARISRGDISWLKMHGKVIDGGSRRRPEPYPTTRSRSSETSKTGKSSEDNRAKGSHRAFVVITLPDDSESEHEINSVTDDDESENEINIVSNDNESDLDYQPDEDCGPIDDGAGLVDAATEDIWPEQFPAEVDLMASTVSKNLSDGINRS